MTISQQGIDLIKHWEQFRSKPYKCPAGIWTQGYGHTRTATASSQPITKVQAEQLLRVDLLTFELQLKFVLEGIDLKQCQYDAIVSFCFNLGVGAFKKSKAFRIIKKDPNSKLIADSWVTFRNANGEFLRGLLLRRLTELVLYYS